jgi:hypothetical protein
MYPELIAKTPGQFWKPPSRRGPSVDEIQDLRFWGLAALSFRGINIEKHKL